jgi:hypothetical protein
MSLLSAGSISLDSTVPLRLAQPSYYVSTVCIYAVQTYIPHWMTTEFFITVKNNKGKYILYIKKFERKQVFSNNIV